jgi:tetratricopeptide (TPR) repeat protein
MFAISLLLRFSTIALCSFGAVLAVNLPVGAIPADVQSVFSQAAQQVEKQEYKLALTALDQVVRRYPNLADAYFQRGKVYIQLMDDIGAIGLPPAVVESYALENLNRAIALQPNLVDAYAKRGKLRFDRGDVPKALLDFDRAIQLNPSDRLYAQRADARIAVGDFSGAKADRDRIQDADYDRRNDQAELLMALGDYAGAIRNLDVVIKSDAEFLEFHHRTSLKFHHRALAKALAKDYQGAIADLDWAIQGATKDDSRLPDYYRDRGLVKWLKGQPQQAMLDLNQALKEAPSSRISFSPVLLAHYLRAALWTELRDQFKVNADLQALEQDAIIDFGQLNEDPLVKRSYLALLQPILARSIGANSVDVHLVRAKVQMALDDQVGAIAAYDAAVRLAPNQVSVYQARLLALRDTRNPAANIADLTQLIRLELNPTTSYGNRARQEIRRGNYAAAIADYNQMIQRYPSRHAYADRGVARIAIGDAKGAVADLTAAIAQLTSRNSDFDGGVSYYVQRAEAYMILGQHDRALRDLQTAERLEVGYPGAGGVGAVSLPMGKLRLAMGDAKGALVAFEQSLQEKLSDHYLVQNGIGLAKLKLGDRAGAVLAFEKAIYANAEPQSVQALYERGVSEGQLVNLRR